MCLRFSQEVIEYLAQSTDTSKSVPMVFAIDETCNPKDIQSQANGKVRSFKRGHIILESAVVQSEMEV